MESFIIWIQNNPIAGPFIICIATSVTVILMGPYTVFAVGSGYAFSHVYDNIAIALSISTAAVFIGAWTGAIIAFFLGRFLCRSRVKSYS